VGQAHIDLIQREMGAINFCEIERRLRRLGLNTRLVALPPALSYDPREYSLVFAHPMQDGVVPRYSLWYERGGEAAAKRLLERVGLDVDGNLRRLNKVGIPAPATYVHQSYVMADKEDRTGLDRRYRRVYDVLSEYRSKGLLENRHNALLMHAAQTYVEPIEGLRFSINDVFSKGVLQLFVIGEDPQGLMARLSCNCVYLPGTSIILCDSALLDALSNWVGYGRGHNGWFGSAGLQFGPAPFLTEVQNESSASFVMHWLIGHEIGHFVMKHDYDNRFVPLVSNGSSKQTANIRTFEASADDFAIRYMPRALKVTSPMTVNFLILTVFDHLRSQQNGGSLEGDKIFVREPKYGHPNFISRVFAFKRAYKLTDSLWDQLYARLRVSDSKGVTITSVCAVVK
jgi:hypothetical protein